MENPLISTKRLKSKDSTQQQSSGEIHLGKGSTNLGPPIFAARGQLLIVHGQARERPGGIPGRVRCQAIPKQASHHQNLDVTTDQHKRC